MPDMYLFPLRNTFFFFFWVKLMEHFHVNLCVGTHPISIMLGVGLVVLESYGLFDNHFSF